MGSLNDHSLNTDETIGVFNKFVNFRETNMFENFICLVAGMAITECMYAYKFGYFKNIHLWEQHKDKNKS